MLLGAKIKVVSGEQSTESFQGTGWQGTTDAASTKLLSGDAQDKRQTGRHQAAFVRIDMNTHMASCSENPFLAERAIRFQLWSKQMEKRSRSRNARPVLRSSGQKKTPTSGWCVN